MKINKNRLIIGILAMSLLVSVTYAGQPGLISSIPPNVSTKNIQQIKDIVSGKANDNVRIIITLKENVTEKNIKILEKKFLIKVGKRWDKAYPKGFGAIIKRDQIQTIESDPSVAKVDIEEKKRIALETANYWSGTTRARNSSIGYGVTGDRDGNQYNYVPEDIVIVVVDTGIDSMHKDLNGTNNGGTRKIIGWYDAVNNITKPYDDNGHGTHVASIAAGEGDDNYRYKGVAPGAALVGVKVCDSGGGCWDSDIIEGINWVIKNKYKYGIEILTMSLGGYGSSDGTDPVSVASNNAFNNGIVVTIAAGNSYDQKYTISSPGAAENAITVTAMADPGYRILKVLSSGANLDVPISPKVTEEKKKESGQIFDIIDSGFYLAPFSSRGPTADNRIKPDIAAPGVAITAALGEYPNTPGYHGGYATWSGTSMATPFVAGVAALILDSNPGASPSQVKSWIRSSGEDYGVSGCDIDYGCGRIRAMKALELATGMFKTDQLVPTHIRNWGYFNDTKKVKVFKNTITTDEFPNAYILIMPDWSGYTAGIDLDIAVFAENISVADSFGYSRQETVILMPDYIGEYKTKIFKYSGAGHFVLDRSFK